MNILVLDVAASSGGASSMLQQYYSEFQEDTKNTYILCVSTPKLASTGNVTVLRYPVDLFAPACTLYDAKIQIVSTA